MFNRDYVSDYLRALGHGSQVVSDYFEVRNGAETVKTYLSEKYFKN